MAVVAQKVDAWLLQQTEYQALLQEINIEMHTILWADDIAIPLATKSAVDLVPFLQTTRHVVCQTLTEYGFVLNFSKGKTSAVLTFRGSGSVDLRKRFQLQANPGVMCDFQDGHQDWLQDSPLVLAVLPSGTFRT